MANLPLLPAHIKDAIDLVAADKVSAAMDILYDEFDKRLWENDNEYFENLFEYFKNEHVNIHIALALLINTKVLNWRSRFPGRQNFLEKIERQLVTDGQDPKPILIGLE